MNKYELVIIFKPDLADKEKGALTRSFEKVVLDFKGKVVKIENWGKKNLVYKIKKFDQGLYVKFDIDLGREKITELVGRLKLDEDIIRYLLVSKKEKEEGK